MIARSEPTTKRHKMRLRDCPAWVQMLTGVGAASIWVGIFHWVGWW